MSLPGDRIYLFDTSIWEYTDHPVIAPDWDVAVEHNRLAVSPIVSFEILYGAKNQTDFEELERELDALRQVPMTQGIVRDARRALLRCVANRAIVMPRNWLQHKGSATVNRPHLLRGVIHDLSAKASHRLPFQDALVAATAAHKNMTVLHYDGHFDVLSTVLGFESRWAAEPGSL